MKILWWAAFVVVSLLSAAAGGAKLLWMEQEVEFFATVGLNPSWLVPLGLLQIGGVGMALWPISRRYGLLLIGAGFLASALIVFATGQMGFGLVSLVPLTVALGLAFSVRSS